jgi:hypothetical protein
MSYEGEILDSCGILDLDFSRVHVIAVSGSGPNFCGHLLLHVDSHGGYYFHVATGDQALGLRGYPRYMNEQGYKRYLKENGKTELKRLPLTLPNPTGALLHMEELLSKRWTWGVLPNNCVAFVEEIIAAGGGAWASASNCPTVATAPTLSHRVQEFIMRVESEIYRQYGVPR